MITKKAAKYLKSEISILPKRDKKWTIRSAAVFPNSYSAAMSNLGFLTLFGTMHEFYQFYPQRFFTGFDGSLEESEPLTSFPFIAVSIPYELDYLNLVSMLRENQIPVRADERANRIVIIGGAAPTINPRPLSKIADVIFVGEGQEFIRQILTVISEFPPGITDKNKILSKLAQIPGAWIPALQSEMPKIAVSTENVPPVSPIVSSFSAFPNMALIQVQRGCPYRCPFCATPVIHNPFCNFPAEKILENISIWKNEIFRVGLIGSAIADHPQISDIMESLISRDIEVYVSSLRLDNVGNRMIGILNNARQRVITFAPETGSARLKEKIGKMIFADDIIRISSQLNSPEIKLYYMVGMPNETMDDVSAIAEEIAEISAGLPSKKISASVNAFIPKCTTLWGNEKMLTHTELQMRFDCLKKSLAKLKRVNLDTNYKRRIRLQWALSCGGNDIAEAIVNFTDISSFTKALRAQGWDI